MTDDQKEIEPRKKWSAARTRRDQVAALKEDLRLANVVLEHDRLIAVSALDERDALRQRCERMERALRRVCGEAESYVAIGWDHADESRALMDAVTAGHEALSIAIPTPPASGAPDHTAEIAAIRETAQREGWENL